MIRCLPGHFSKSNMAPISSEYGPHMKTTLEIRDDLLDRARRQARSRGTTLRAILESALEAQLARAPARKAKHPRIRVFDAPRPAHGMTLDWNQMKDFIYTEREARIIRGRG